MIPILTAEELRVLGCLIEKQITTPEYYPMSLNAIINACNQKSAREPMVQYDEVTVQKALDSLRAKGLAAVITGAGIRSPKYRHYFKEKSGLGDAQIAVLTELMLRGPQTPGELRARAERMYAFAGLEEVDEILRDFCEREAPLAIKLPRLPGQKEQRFMHLLAGPPDMSSWSQAVVSQGDAQLLALEKKVALLEQEMAQLKRAFEAWKAQFE